MRIRDAILVAYVWVDGVFLVCQHFSFANPLILRGFEHRVVVNGMIETHLYPFVFLEPKLTGEEYRRSSHGNANNN